MSPREVIRRMQLRLAALAGAAHERQTKLVASTLRLQLRELAQARRGSWTEASAAATVAQLRRALGMLPLGMVSTLGEDLRTTARASHRDAAAYLRAGDSAYAGATRRLRFEAAGFLDDRVAVAGQARIANFAPSFQRYGASLTAAVEQAAARAALLGVSYHSAIGEVAGRLRSEAALKDWEIRRTVETEVSAAYNQMQLDALIAEDTPSDRMLKRLVATFDNVTGRDSVLLHAQVRPVREPFYDAHNGRSFMAPPNRPHDRELLVGVRDSWQAALVDDETSATPIQPAPAPRQVRPPRPVARPGQAVRKARNLRAGDVLAAPGRPRIVHVSEGTGGKIAVKTERGLLLYFAAGAAIGILASS